MHKTDFLKFLYTNMKKVLLWIFTLTVLIFISGCSIKIEKNQNITLQEQISWLQEQLSWLEQKVNSLEIENAELKKKTSTTQSKKSTTPVQQPKEKDNCPNGDQTISTYDWICDYPHA